MRLCNENLCGLAANFADAGFTPVIDWVVPDRQQLDLYREALSRRRLLVVALAPGIDICRYRDAIRDPQEQFSFDGYETLMASMRGSYGTIGWWIDTSDLTADETARQILAKAPALAAVGP